VTGSDFRGPLPAARLLKFHGCALRAIENEADYRGLIIARYSQIVSWTANNKFENIKQELVALATRSRTLMIGMSAQDPNIPQIFQLAATRLPWTWSDDPPPYVFAEDQLGDDQKTILRIAYGNDFNVHQAEILRRSCIRAYGKSLLLALVLHIMSYKLCWLLREVEAPGLQLNDFIELMEGIKDLRNLAAQAVEPDPIAFVRTLVWLTSRAKAMLQEGRVLTVPEPLYWAISSRPVHQVPHDPNLTPTGQREAANGLALLGLGHRDGHWTLSLDDPADRTSGTVKVKSTLSQARVIFVAHSAAALQLFNQGVYGEDDDDVILMHSTVIVLPQKRSPAKRLGRTGKRGPRHIELNTLVRDAVNVDDLRLRFRQEAAL
jgi:hypothetical protein